MKNTISGIYPNAWNFGNSDKQLKSPEQKIKIEYDDLNEIAMGAPLGGQCFLVTEAGEKYLIDKWCSGPAIWDHEGKKVAIPKWTKTFWKGTIQQLMILDTKTGELTLFKKKFNVLDLRTFDKNEICGYDSPIHKTRTINFNLEAEKIEEKRKITGANNG